MEKFRLSPEKLAFVESMEVPVALYQYGSERVLTLALSKGFCDLYGYTDLVQAYRDMDNAQYGEVHPDDTVRLADAADRFASGGEKYEIIYRFKPRNREGYRVIHAFGRHVDLGEGVNASQVWYTDEGPYVEEAKTGRAALSESFSAALHEESIFQAAHYDHLTGLPNIAHFFELADEGRHGILRAGGHAALLYIDLNGMKAFNSNHGFAEGNELLKDFARLLARTFGKENSCHMGADHFAAYCPYEGLEAKLDRFLEDCREVHGGENLPVHIGVYSNELENVPVSTAYDRAKVACDTLKGSYRSAWQGYTPDLGLKIARKQYILEHFDEAMRERWVDVYYQPIIRAVNGRVCDEEALARWVDPNWGVLPPSEFIPHLEAAGLIHKLDLYVLERVLEKMRLQRDLVVYAVPHSINLSRADFDNCDIVEEIRRRVDESGFSRSMINVEITESIVGSDFEFIREQVRRFRDLGFPVWMDDFGSGYSSLDVLQSIKFNLLKFDMGFMQKLDQGESGRIILTELMKMATALGVETVCEGVETEEQVRFLQGIGCSRLQGYYFSKPIPMEALFEKYRKNMRFGQENPEEAAYYDAIGGVNLYDLSMIAGGNENDFQNVFNTLPMAILELREDQVRFIRTNPSYREFMSRFYGLDLTENAGEFAETPFGADSSFMELVRACCRTGNRAFFDEKLPDGSEAHSFARRVSTNPVTGTTAAAVAVLSITSRDEERERLLEIRQERDLLARVMALAEDYLSLYTVDPATGEYVEYMVSGEYEALGVEKSGEDFFLQGAINGKNAVHPEDLPRFLERFTREKVMAEIRKNGVFKLQYRLLLGGKAKKVTLKIAPFTTGGEEKLFAGVRAWRDRR